MEFNIIFFAAFLILLSVWIEEKTYERSMSEVKRRWASGDRKCRLKKRWFGYTVTELDGPK